MAEPVNEGPDEREDDDGDEKAVETSTEVETGGDKTPPQKTPLGDY